MTQDDTCLKTLSISCSATLEMSLTIQSNYIIIYWLNDGIIHEVYYVSQLVLQEFRPS
jgi:hypothetical protein